MVIVKDSIINAGHFDSIPSGFYQGMLPCKNCEGIQRTILFLFDRFAAPDDDRNHSYRFKVCR